MGPPPAPGQHPAGQRAVLQSRAPQPPRARSACTQLAVPVTRMSAFDSPMASAAEVVATGGGGALGQPPAGAAPTPASTTATVNQPQPQPQPQPQGDVAAMALDLSMFTESEAPALEAALGNFDHVHYAGQRFCPCRHVCAMTDDDASVVAQLDALEAEVRGNKFGRVLTTPEGEQLRAIAERKQADRSTNPRELNAAEILAILLYTGTAVQGYFRKNMREADQGRPGTWPVLAKILQRAICRQGLYEQHSPKAAPAHPPPVAVVYHGLHNLQINTTLNFLQHDAPKKSDATRTPVQKAETIAKVMHRLCFTIKTAVSASRSKDVALQFAAGIGGTVSQAAHSDCAILLEITCRSHGGWPAAADVACFSKFRSEQEVLLCPWQNFYPSLGNATLEEIEDGIVKAMEKRVRIEQVERVKVVSTDASTTWSAQHAELNLNGTCPHIFPIETLQIGQFLLAILWRRDGEDVTGARANDAANEESGWRLVQNGLNRGWIRVENIKPMGRVNIQVLCVDARAPTCKTGGDVAPVEKSPEAKGCGATLTEGSSDLSLEPEPEPEPVAAAEPALAGEPALEPEPQPEQLDQMLARLIDLGYDAHTCRAALDAARGNFRVAADLLIKGFCTPASTLLQAGAFHTPPLELTESLCYLSTAQESFCNDHGLQEFVPLLPCWVSQARISRVMFGARGEELVRIVSEHVGNFLWATEFANVHSSFSFQEPGIEIDGTRYGGPEQFFQVMKSFGTRSHAAAMEAMKTADTEEAWRIGRSHDLRADWEEVKVGVMKRAVYAKFTQDSSLRALLVSTGHHPLLQLKPQDSMWGSGPDGTGQNMLGVLLMQLRETLQ